MRVRGTSIDTQVGQLNAGQTGHLASCAERLSPDHTLRELALDDLTSSALFDAAGMTGVPVIFFVLVFATSQFDFVGIDYDNIVTTIHMWREGGFVFAAKTHGDQRCQGDPAPDLRHR